MYCSTHCFKGMSQFQIYSWEKVPKTSETSLSLTENKYAQTHLSRYKAKVNRKSDQVSFFSTFCYNQIIVHTVELFSKSG